MQALARIPAGMRTKYKYYTILVSIRHKRRP